MRKSLRVLNQWLHWSSVGEWCAQRKCITRCSRYIKIYHIFILPPLTFLTTSPLGYHYYVTPSMSGWGVANRLQSVTRRLRHQTHPRCWIYSRINQIWKKGSLKGRRRRRRMEYGIDGAMSRARSGALRTFSPDASLSLSLSPRHPYIIFIGKWYSNRALSVTHAVLFIFFFQFHSGSQSGASTTSIDIWRRRRRRRRRMCQPQSHGDGSASIKSLFHLFYSLIHPWSVSWCGDDYRKEGVAYIISSMMD